MAKSATERHDNRHFDHRANEAWWREEIGIEVEHEIWHLPRLAEQQQSQA